MKGDIIMSNKKANATINATLTMNEEKKGVEIAFAEKPDKTVLSDLKGAGFHWHNGRQIWYAKVSDQTVTLAKSICGIEEPTVTVAKALSGKKNGKKSEAKAEPTKAEKLDSISVSASMVKEEPKAEVEKPTSYEELLDMLVNLDVKSAKACIERNIELLKAYQSR